ncbi:UNVERIFIED_CONTAM: RNA cytidine acetyltransferase, partial [Eudyptes robustus]
QDFEAITPNLLARTVETVKGGGLVLILLPAISNLKQLYSITMDVHSRYRTHSHQQIVNRFNERFLLSLSDCADCAVIDDQLNILPISSHILNLEPVPPTLKMEKSETELELEDLKTKMSDVKPLGTILKECKTLCQAKVVLRLLDILTERTSAICAITAARGRGKSAALGLAIAGGISFGLSNIYVTSPTPDNVKTLFQFVIEGFKALNLKEHVDYTINYSKEEHQKGLIMGFEMFKRHKQTIKYLVPTENNVLTQGELLVIDEAAAIPLPIVQNLTKGNNIVFFSSTTHGYEGTGRSLSLKLIQQLRKRSTTSSEGKDGRIGRLLHEMTLEESIRYKPGDKIEKWLFKFLCLDSMNTTYKISGSPPPEVCQLYHVNLDALFSYHKAAELFLSKVMSIFVSAHYKNNPNDLQMLSDAPAQLLFVLMSPVSNEITDIPDILAVAQIVLEGEIPDQQIRSEQSKGRRAAGDLIPWTLCQYYLDYSFPKLAGARIIRLAVHSEVQGMGYGGRVVELLQDYFEGNVVCVNEKSEDEFKIRNIKDDLESDSDLKPPTELPPLLRKLTERRAEKLDYLGVSYGLNVQLLKFWKKGGFVPVYLRTTPSPVTGEYSCIMLKPLATEGNNEIQKKNDWVYTYNAEFRRRFLSLLGFQFRNFSPHLVLSLLQKTNDVIPIGKVLKRDEVPLFLTDSDLKRLSNYTRNMADYSFIADLLPNMAHLYFSDSMDGVELNALQSASLLSMGLQRKSAEEVAGELNIEVGQLMALFNKVARKISDYFDNLCKSAIEGNNRVTEVTMKPTERSLIEDLKNAEMEIRMRQAKDKLDLSQSLGFSSGSIPSALKQFEIKAGDDEFQKTVGNVHLSHARHGGIISVKTNKGDVVHKSLIDRELEEIEGKKQNKRPMRENKRKTVKKF